MSVARAERRTINPVAAAAPLRMVHALEPLGGALYGRGLGDVPARLGWLILAFPPAASRRPSLRRNAEDDGATPHERVRAAARGGARAAA